MRGLQQTFGNIFQTISTTFERVLQIIILAIPHILLALLLLLVAWLVAAIAKAIIVRGGEKARLPRLFQKAKLAHSEEEGMHLLETLGKFVYFLIFIFVLPSVFDALNMQAISEPISNMVSNFLSFIPNLIGAGFILFVGWFLAKLGKEAIVNITRGFGVDRLPQKLGIAKEVDLKEPGRAIQLSTIIGNIVYALIIIPVAISALQVLNIEAISKPATNMLNQILGIIPNIIAASILLIIGILIAKLVGDLIKGLLTGTGIDALTDNLQTDESLPNIPRFSISIVIGEVVRYLIIILFAVEAFNVLKLSVLQSVGTAIIGYLPFLLGAIITLTVGIFAASFVQKFIDKFTGHPSFLGKILRYFIIGFTVFMTLDQLKLAPNIVTLTFLATAGALAIAFALSFGIGGRDFASKQLEKLNKKMERESVLSPKGENKDIIIKTEDVEK